MSGVGGQRGGGGAGRGRAGRRAGAGFGSLAAPRYLVTTLMGADLNNIVSAVALLRTSTSSSSCTSAEAGWGRWGAEREREAARGPAPDAPPSPPAVHPLGRDHPPQVRCAEAAGIRARDSAGLTGGLPAPQDLKPSNVAVNEDCELRVSSRGRGWEAAAGRWRPSGLKPGHEILDFGLARSGRRAEMTGYVATRVVQGPGDHAKLDAPQPDR